VTYEGLAVSGGPSVFSAYDVSAITISPVPTVAAGKTAEFTGNTSVSITKTLRTQIDLELESIKSLLLGCLLFL